MEEYRFSEEVRRIIYEEVPRILREHPKARLVILDMISSNAAEREATERRFERMFQELREHHQRLEEQNRKFEEHNRKFDQILKRLEENDRKFDQIFKRLEENDRKFEKMFKKLEEHEEEINEAHKKIGEVDNKIARTLGSLGARWGTASENAFREALKDALERLTDLKVFRYQEKDREGIIFGRPDQVEIDVVISNGEVWLFELKSGVSKADVFYFKKKAEFYEKKEGRKPTRLVIISPIPIPQAIEAARYLGIELYFSPEHMERKEQVKPEDLLWPPQSSTER